jgi:hypothetical protein
MERLKKAFYTRPKHYFVLPGSENVSELDENPKHYEKRSLHSISSQVKLLQLLPWMISLALGLLCTFLLSTGFRFDGLHGESASSATDFGTLL